MNRLQQIWKAKEVRNKILFVLAMLFIYRVAAHIPIPGIDATGLKDFLQVIKFWVWSTSFRAVV